MDDQRHKVLGRSFGISLDIGCVCTGGFGNMSMWQHTVNFNIETVQFSCGVDSKLWLLGITSQYRASSRDT